MKNHILIAALGVAVFAATAAANAETLKVSWDEPGGVMASWLQSSDPTPSDYLTDAATTVPVTDFTGRSGLTIKANGVCASNASGTKSTSGS